MTLRQYLHKDLYEILGITYEADVVRIKGAYRKLARTCHPDVNHNTPESIARFKEITEAYELLIDSDKRRHYDSLKGFSSRRYTDTQSARPDAQKSYAKASEFTKKYGTKAYEKTAQQYKDSFSSLFNTILDGLFSSEDAVNDKKVQREKGGKEEKKKPEKETKKEKREKGGKGVQSKAKDGRDINLNVTIKVAEVLSGTHRTVNVLHTEQCPKCEGRRFINDTKCPMCKGTGEISIHKKLSVKIPPHVKKGAKIRIANEGNKGCCEGRDGDLYLHIDIEESAFFKCEGTNAYCEIPVTPYEAALGADIKVPTPTGSVYMKVPAGTTSGQKFRLSGEGFKDGTTGKNGDQIVTIKIEMPKDLSEDEKVLYEKLKNLSHQTIRENLGDA